MAEKDKQFEKEKQRQLSEAEQKRFDRFTKICADLDAKGYRKTELTVGIVKANVFAFALAIPVYALSYLFFFKRNSGMHMTLSDLLIFLGACFGLIVVHELIHGVTWSVFCENHFKDIEFGFMKEYMTPYCTCCTPLKKMPYILGALMPLIVLGIIPTVIAIFVGSFLLLNIGLLMTVSAGGDILIVLKLLSYRSDAQEILYYDHPTQAGGVVFEK